eukprot:4378924-Pleurochrysis_carterae.AAC.1
MAGPVPVAQHQHHPSRSSKAHRLSNECKRCARVRVLIRAKMEHHGSVTIISASVCSISVPEPLHTQPGPWLLCLATNTPHQARAQNTRGPHPPQELLTSE